MTESFHIYLSSEDSKRTYPRNSPADYTTILPERLQLNKGTWWCGLVELQLTDSLDKPCYLCTDVCTNSIVGELSLPVLCLIRNKSTQPKTRVYAPVKTSELSNIRIYLK